MCTIVIDHNPSQADNAVVVEGLISFNEGITGEPRDKAFSIFLKNNSGKIFGGLKAFFDTESVYVDTLWVDDKLRHQDWGTKLMNAAEQEAIKNGCIFSLVDTWDFQAEGFYLKMGYERIGELKNYWHHHSKIFLRKRLKGDKILFELNNKNIEKLGTEAITDFYKTMAIDKLILPGLNAFITGDNSPSLNVLIDTRESQTTNAETVQQLNHFFENHSVPWGWFITDINKSKDIEQHGFHFLYEAPSMYFDLSIQLPVIITNSIDIRSADDELFEWILPIQEGFANNESCEIYRKLNAKLQQSGEKKLQHFIAYYQDEPASAGTLFLSDNAVMIHNLATKNKFLKQGFGTALTLHMMSVAKKAGYKHCFLDSSDEGFNLYSRLGFKVYGKTWVYEKFQMNDPITVLIRAPKLEDENAFIGPCNGANPYTIHGLKHHRHRKNLIATSYAFNNSVGQLPLKIG